MRLGLSQAEIAFLLGAPGGAKMCRYERFARQPSLQAALACEAIFQKPVRELFQGLYDRIEQQVSARAKVLSHRTRRQRPTRRNERKLAILLTIAGRQAKLAIR